MPVFSRQAYVLLLLSAVALMFIGPFRSAFAALPLVPFLSTLFLFLIPGMLLSRWFLAEHIRGPATLPVSFALSAGIFGFLGVPLLVLHRSLGLYVSLAGAILATFMVAAVFGTLRRKSSVENDATLRFSFSWLWVPFLLLSAALGFMSWARVPFPYDDIWVYLAHVREFLNTDKLALYEPYFGDETGTSRLQINGWLLEQAAFSRVSGVDSVELMLRYLAPTLVVVSLLSFYALARILLKSEAAALLAGSLYALFFLAHLGPTWFFTARIPEDKFVAWFLFLPVALVFALLFLESRKLRHLMVFAFLCWSVVAVHPVGLAIIGLSTAGFGLVHVAVNRREKGAWIGAMSLGAALLSVLLAPALYVVATGDSFTAFLKSADINSGDPDVLANMVFVKPQYEIRLLELGDGSYMVHPSRLLNPATLVAFLFGLPFLLRRLKGSLAAQLLVGMLLVPTAVCYVPPIATFFGNHLVLPGQLWRLAWPIPLAAMLIVGWMVWEAGRYTESGLNRLRGSRHATGFLPLVLVAALMAAAAPESVAGIERVYRTDEELAQVERSCFDPSFRWMQTNITRPSVVLAPDLENTCIPAYSAQANVVSLRGGRVLRVLDALQQRAPGRIEVPQGALDVQRFFHRSTLEEKVRILRRHEADYLMLPTDSPFNGKLKRRPGFAAIDTPGERYSLYAVNRRSLGHEARPVAIPSPRTSENASSRQLGE